MFDSQYLTGSLVLGGHSAISQAWGRLPSAARPMLRLAGRARMAKKCDRMAAVGLVLVALDPVRQVTRRQALRPAAVARSRRFAGAVQ